jgi:hypothetical protein
VQLLKILARVLIFAEGTLSPAGNDAPGEAPVVIFANCAAVPNAFASPAEFVELAPTLPPLE